MTDRIAIFGYGPVGRATAARLIAEGREVVVAQRRAPVDLPKGATFAPADALDRDTVVKAVREAGQFVVTIGFPYSGVLWRQVWPKAIANFIAACKATGARMVFIRISAMPAWMLGPSAMFSPFLRELKEMRFQWDRPYQVDASVSKLRSGRTSRRSKPASPRPRAPFVKN